MSGNNDMIVRDVAGDADTAVGQSEEEREASHHVTNDLLPGVFLRLDRSVQLAEHKDAKLLILQQAAHFFHVEPSDSLTIQDALHHLL